MHLDSGTQKFWVFYKFPEFINGEVRTTAWFPSFRQQQVCFSQCSYCFLKVVQTTTTFLLSVYNADLIIRVRMQGKIHEMYAKSIQKVYSQPCTRKNRDIYWRRYKIQETLCIGRWHLSSLQSRHLGTSHGSPSCHQLPCHIFLNLINGLKSLPFQRWF